MKIIAIIIAIITLTCRAGFSLPKQNGAPKPLIALQFGCGAGRHHFCLRPMAEDVSAEEKRIAGIVERIEQRQAAQARRKLRARPKQLLYSDADAMVRIFLDALDTEKLPYDEQEGLTQLVRQGDSEAMERLVVSNLKGVMGIARKFHLNHPRVPLADFFEYGVLGLVNAIHNYSPEKILEELAGQKAVFYTYATICIRNAMKDGLAEQRPGLHIPAYIIARYLVKVLEYCRDNNIKPFKANKEEIREIAKAVNAKTQEIADLLLHLEVIPLEGYLREKDDNEEFYDIGSMLMAYEAITRHRTYLDELTSRELAITFAEIVTKEAFDNELKKFSNKLAYQVVFRDRVWPMLLGVNRNEPLTLEETAELIYFKPEPSQLKSTNMQDAGEVTDLELGEDFPRHVVDPDEKDVEQLAGYMRDIKKRRENVRQTEERSLNLLCRTIMRMEGEGKLMDYDKMARTVVVAIIMKEGIKFFHKENKKMKLNKEEREKKMADVKAVLEMMILPKIGIGIKLKTPMEILRIRKAKEAGIPIERAYRVSGGGVIETVLDEFGNEIDVKADMRITAEEIEELYRLGNKCLSVCQEIVENNFKKTWSDFLKFMGTSEEEVYRIGEAARQEVLRMRELERAHGMVAAMGSAA